MVRSCFVGTSLHETLRVLDTRGLRALVVDPCVRPIAIASHLPSDTAYEIAVVIGLHLLSVGTAQMRTPDAHGATTG